MSTLIQGSKEWFELRKSKIGASDAPIIMGVSPWTTPYELWEEKLLEVDVHEPTAPMQRGLRLEDKARLVLEEATGHLFRPDVCFHSNNNWMMASLDAIDIERKHIAEIKCPGKEDHELALAGRIPDKYFPQVQHQLAVYELDMAYYFSFDGEKGALVNVYRDDTYIKSLIKKELEFFNCLQELTAPELSERDYRYKTDENWGSVALEWLVISSQLNFLERREKELKNSLISMSQKRNSIGGGVKVSRYMRKGSIAYSMIPELNSIDLEKFRKESVECWKVSAT